MKLLTTFRNWKHRNVFLAFLSGFLFIYGCGTRTKTKTETSNELSVKETAKQTDSIAKIDSIITAKVEIRMKELEQKFRETQQEEETKKTTITTKETIFDNPDWETLPKSGKTIHNPTGRVVETKTVIEEKRKAQKETENNIKLIESERIKKDSIAFNSAVSLATKDAVSEILAKEKNNSLQVKKTGLSIWWKIGIGLFLLLLVAIWVFRKWLLIQFPFLAIFKRKKE